MLSEQSTWSTQYTPRGSSASCRFDEGSTSVKQNSYINVVIVDKIIGAQARIPHLSSLRLVGWPIKWTIAIFPATLNWSITLRRVLILAWRNTRLSSYLFVENVNTHSSVQIICPIWIGWSRSGFIPVLKPDRLLQKIIQHDHKQVWVWVRLAFSNSTSFPWSYSFSLR